MVRFSYLIIGLFLALFAAGKAFAQEEKPSRYLLNDAASISGFGGMMTEFSALGEETSFLFGGGGGVVLYERLFLGGYGMGTLNEVSARLDTDQDVQTDFGHGGFWMAYQFRPQRIIQPGVSARVAGGGLTIKDRNGAKLFDDNVFVLQAALETNLQLLPWMKARLAGGYRWVSGASNPVYDNGDLSQPMVSFGLFFGWFGDPD